MLPCRTVINTQPATLTGLPLKEQPCRTVINTQPATLTGLPLKEQPCRTVINTQPATLPGLPLKEQRCSTINNNKHPPLTGIPKCSVTPRPVAPSTPKDRLSSRKIRTLYFHLSSIWKHTAYHWYYQHSFIFNTSLLWPGQIHLDSVMYTRSDWRIGSHQNSARFIYALQSTLHLHHLHRVNMNHLHMVNMNHLHMALRQSHMVKSNHLQLIRIHECSAANGCFNICFTWQKWSDYLKVFADVLFCYP